MKNCLVTETETLLKMSQVRRVKSIFFGGGEYIVGSVMEIDSHIVSGFMRKDSDVTDVDLPYFAE